MLTEEERTIINLYLKNNKEKFNKFADDLFKLSVEAFATLNSMGVDTANDGGETSKMIFDELGKSFETLQNVAIAEFKKRGVIFPNSQS